MDSMKKLILVSWIIVQSCVAFAQNCCVNDSVVREIQFPLTEHDTETVFCYLNNGWIAGACLDMVPTDSIQKVEIKNDEYGNRAVFLTVSPETVAEVKAGLQKRFINLDPRCEFPGGNGKLKEWIDANIKVPEGYKGCERVMVNFTVHPDGSISNTKIRRPSKNEAANEEAIRLVNALPKFRVKYSTPRKSDLNYCISITFKEPGTIFIRGGESSFINQFSIIENKIRQLYENLVFATVKDSNFNISDICTADFIQRLEEANDFDTKGYATWLLRSGMQDGDGSSSRVISVFPGADNTVIVNWSDMGHRGSTTFSMIETDGGWKISNATVPEGYNPL